MHFCISEANKFAKKINNGTNGRKITEKAASMSNESSSTTAAVHNTLAFNIQNSSEVSSSQVNFFKMLDEKIENVSSLFFGSI